MRQRKESSPSRAKLDSEGPITSQEGQPRRILSIWLLRIHLAVYKREIMNVAWRTASKGNGGVLISGFSIGVRTI